MATATKKTASQNGNGEKTPEQKLTEAIAYEEQIRVEAEAIWTQDEHVGMDFNSYLLRLLRPLLRRQIPTGYIERVPPTKGKPYESTGVRSVQVQFDRLDNVIGPENWGYEATYSDSGRVCHVKAWIGPKDSPLFTRDSYGGVQAGTGEGNIRKGAFTNAAKLAFARLGPGWEVYVGAADFDPDTDKDAAEQQGKTQDAPPPIDTIDAERAAELVTTYLDLKGKAENGDDFAKAAKMQFGGMNVPTPSINGAIAALSPAQADEFEVWLANQAMGGAS